MKIKLMKQTFSRESKGLALRHGFKKKPDFPATKIEATICNHRRPSRIRKHARHFAEITNCDPDRSRPLFSSSRFRREQTEPISSGDFKTVSQPKLRGEASLENVQNFARRSPTHLRFYSCFFSGSSEKQITTGVLSNPKRTIRKQNTATSCLFPKMLFPVSRQIKKIWN